MEFRIKLYGSDVRRKLCDLKKLNSRDIFFLVIKLREEKIYLENEKGKRIYDLDFNDYIPSIIAQKWNVISF